MKPILWIWAAWQVLAILFITFWILTKPVQAADFNRKSDYQRQTFEQRFGSFCIYDTTKQSQMEALIRAARNEQPSHRPARQDR